MPLQLKAFNPLMTEALREPGEHYPYLVHGASYSTFNEDIFLEILLRGGLS